MFGAIPARHLRLQLPGETVNPASRTSPHKKVEIRTQFRLNSRNINQLPETHLPLFFAIQNPKPPKSSDRALLPRFFSPTRRPPTTGQRPPTSGTVPCVPKRSGVDTGGLSLFESNDPPTSNHPVSQPARPPLLPPVRRPCREPVRNRPAYSPETATRRRSAKLPPDSDQSCRFSTASVASRSSTR